MKTHYHTIIIGGGIGGSAAALRAAQNGMSAMWFTGSKTTRKRSRSQWVMNLDNIVGFHEDVIKNQVIKTLKRSKEESAADLISQTHYYINNRLIIQNTIDRISEYYPNITIIHEEVQSLKKLERKFEIESESSKISTESIILATGVMDKQPILTKQNKKGLKETSAKWIYPFANREQVLYCIRCEGHLTQNHHIAIIGNDNICAETAMMIHERYNTDVTILTNGDEPEISDEGLKLLTHYEICINKKQITDIVSKSVRELNGFQLDDNSVINVKFALVSLGLHRVYNDIAIMAGAELLDDNQPQDKRHIRVNNKGESTVKNFFVVGDAAKRIDEPIMKQVYTAQEYAVRAVDTIDSRKRKKIRLEILNNAN
jgi:thioredoxin reductase (NADPH)